MINILDKIKVMKAYAEGEPIQYRHTQTMPDKWQDWKLNSSPMWNWGYIEYRIKPYSLNEKVDKILENFDKFISITDDGNIIEWDNLGDAVTWGPANCIVRSVKVRLVRVDNLDKEETDA